ncbi:Putative DNA-binding protein in cluster with Type I restriction-modification system [Bathymodiolus thermophilus thioautotrophic gill symbiont]|jgi:hypothetical protein|uniref:Cytochrome C n=3 Tax=sulfur-oxidizing symbionts TaxID=32036 RepID=A0A1H6JJJ3_9GAMM|nr:MULTISPECIES: virulence protein [sulfur-oxidizing symbionts]CAC9522490.1 Putative DNA-binding protein in cluster with Type I restriction-modification system [uncultured Gammaproteobacteria bacterium]CAB5497607.1 Putative DNA-binding protein in cluster with Type I restriction-modification system [Bathymodiolus azoricus thioautotrophic gill symbiont]CAB5507042.1 Putative DNA-binding protein in cluster with Type I restriction-modification system [Bathymodiolus thermophilus thioautotrophic gill s
MTKNLVIYQAKNGAIELKLDLNVETVRASQKDIVNIFDKDQSVILRHIKKILLDKEVDEKSNMQKMHIVNSDKPIVYYLLDIILAVGYRTNFAKTIQQGN